MKQKVEGGLLGGILGPYFERLEAEQKPARFEEPYDGLQIAKKNVPRVIFPDNVTVH